MSEAKTIYQDAQPIGAYIPFGDDIDPKEDKLFAKKTVLLKDEYGKVYSTHLVETYLIKEGKFKGRMYHLFTWINGRSVMNYSPEDYFNLSEFVDISFQFTIFQKDSDGILGIPISPDYRLETK